MPLLTITKKNISKKIERTNLVANQSSHKSQYQCYVLAYTIVYLYLSSVSSVQCPPYIYDSYQNAANSRKKLQVELPTTIAKLPNNAQTVKSTDDHQAHDEAADVDKSGQSKSNATAQQKSVAGVMLTTLLMVLLSKVIVS